MMETIEGSSEAFATQISPRAREKILQMYERLLDIEARKAAFTPVPYSRQFQALRQEPPPAVSTGAPNPLPEFRP